MSITLTPQQADVAAEVVQYLRSKGDRSRTPGMTDAARQVLTAQIRRYALAANAARRVSQILLPPLPGDDELDGAPAFETFGDAQAWLLANADGIDEALIAANQCEADVYSSRVVRGLEQVLTSLHDVDRRVRWAGLALASARRQGDILAEAHALMNRGGGYKMGGQPLNAVTDYRDAAHLFTVNEDAAGQVVALSRLAVAHTSARQLDEADGVLDQVLALCSTGDEVLAALAHVNRSWVSNERGVWDKAVEYGLAGLDKLRMRDAAQVWMVEAYLQLVIAYTGACDVEKARFYLAALELPIADGSENVPVRIAEVVVAGELMLVAGRHQDAVAAFRRAVALQSTSPHPYQLANALDGLGKALFELGELDQAVEQHTAALSVRVRTGEPFATARTRYHLAKALADCGRVDAAARQHEKALTELAGLVDPAADTLRAELNRMSL